MINLYQANGQKLEEQACHLRRKIWASVESAEHLLTMATNTSSLSGPVPVTRQASTEYLAHPENRSINIYKKMRNSSEKVHRNKQRLAGRNKSAWRMNLKNSNEFVNRKEI